MNSPSATESMKLQAHDEAAHGEIAQILTARFIARGEDRTRADVVRRSIPYLTDGQVLDAFECSARLGGESEPDRLVHSGESFCLNYEHREPSEPVRYELIHEDHNALVCNKYPGYPVHPTGRFYFRTLLHALRRDGWSDVRCVHRLDASTSGVVIFAKTSIAAKELTSRWTDIRKHYLAISEGWPGWHYRVEKTPIPTLLQPSHALNSGSTGEAPVRLRPATTAVRVIQLGRTTAGERFALIGAELLSGRRHQIRLHLSHLGHPIVGDSRYGGAARAKRTMLHAAHLDLPAGILDSATPRRFEAPAPTDFLECRVVCGLADPLSVIQESEGAKAP